MKGYIMTALNVIREKAIGDILMAIFNGYKNEEINEFYFNDSFETNIESIDKHCIIELIQNSDDGVYVFSYFNRYFTEILDNLQQVNDNEPLGFDLDYDMGSSEAFGLVRFVLAGILTELYDVDYDGSSDVRNIIVSHLNDRFKLNIKPFINEHQLQQLAVKKLHEDVLNGDTSILDMLSNEQLVEYLGE